VRCCRGRRRGGSTAYRVDKSGKGSFDRVMKGLAALHRRDVDWNALTTVHAANQDCGREVYAFLRDECGRGSCSSSRSRSGPASRP